MTKPNVPQSTEYQIALTGRHIDITEPIEAYVSEKIHRVDHMAHKIMDASVVLEVQKLEYSCSILMNFLHFHIRVHASTDNMYSAIDKCTDKLFALVSKYKSKLQSKQGEHLGSVDIQVNVLKPSEENIKVINEDIDEENAHREYERYHLHSVVEKESVSVKTHTQDEAIMRMEFSHEPFMIYRSEEDQKIKVMYRRPDNNFNLVQIQ